MIHFQVEMEDLTQIEAALGMARDKSRMVLRAAINNSAKEIEKRMVDDTKRRYALKGGKAKLREANKIHKATVAKLEAVIEAKGGALDLVDYQVSPPTYFPGSKGAPSWIKARVRKDNHLERMARRRGASGDKYKGFVVRYKSGHIAFAERVPGKAMKGNPAKEAIESLYSLAKPKAEEIAYMEYIHEDVNNILMKHIQSQMYRFLK